MKLPDAVESSAPSRYATSMVPNKDNRILYALSRKRHSFGRPRESLLDRLLKAHSSVHPLLLNNRFRHEASNNPDRPSLTIFPNGGLVWCSWRGLMSSPIAYPGSLMLGGPGDDIRVFVRLRT